MTTAYLASAGDYTLAVEHGWFRSPSTTVRHGCSENWNGLGYDCVCGDIWLTFQQECATGAKHGEERRVVVSPPAQCVPHPCGECGGRGTVLVDDDDDTYLVQRYRVPCRRCGGSGVVAEPLLIGDEQCREGNGPWGQWCANVSEADRVWNETHSHERRQALLARVTLESGPLEVVTQDHPMAALDFGDGRTHLLVLDERSEELQDLTDVLGGKVAPGDQLWRCSAVVLDEPISFVREWFEDEGELRWDTAPLALPLGEFVSLEVEQP